MCELHGSSYTVGPPWFGGRPKLFYWDVTVICLIFSFFLNFVLCFLKVASLFQLSAFTNAQNHRFGVSHNLNSSIFDLSLESLRSRKIVISAVFCQNFSFQTFKLFDGSAVQYSDFTKVDPDFNCRFVDFECPHSPLGATWRLIDGAIRIFYLFLIYMPPLSALNHFLDCVRIAFRLSFKTLKFRRTSSKRRTARTVCRIITRPPESSESFDLQTIQMAANKL